jgi:two-component system, NarL family, sensor histidine kinase UhpB
MSRPLRLLLIEDDEDDATLLIWDLRQGGFEPTWQRVETLAALRQALPAESWDLIVGDYHLPTCTGLEALAVVRASGLDIPFLLISGTIGEEAAVAAMKAGAADYLTKHHLARLIPVVERELREAVLRRQARQVAVERLESDQRLRLAVEVAQLGTFEWDMVANEMHFDEQATAIFGLPAGAALDTFETALGIVHAEDRELVQRALAESVAGAAPRTREFRIVRPDGSLRWIASKATIQRDAHGQPLRLIGVVQDIHERKGIEEELRAQTERLHYLSQQLLSAQETERRCMARELHDEIGQGLTAALITVQMMQHHASAAALSGELAEAAALLDTTLQQVRTMSLELRPAMLDDLGLVPALKWHLDRAGQRSGLRIRLTAATLHERLPAALETVCYRVVQEAVTNVVRHARAQEVRVQVERTPEAVQLTIADDGRGFDTAAAQARAEAGGSLGLLSMQERVTLLGGTLHLDSAPGRGCRVFARLPLLWPPPTVEMKTEAAHL